MTWAQMEALIVEDPEMVTPGQSEADLSPEAMTTGSVADAMSLAAMRFGVG